MKIILTRHGRTEENEAGILQGHLPGKLSAKGIYQAQKVASRLKDEVFDYAYSSDLARSADTAREIMRYHPGVPIEFTEELREAYLGSWQGRKKSEVGSLDTPADMLGPEDGETSDELREQARKFLESIRRKHQDDTVLLVWHNGINRRIVGILTEQDSVESIGNTSVSIFEIDDQGNVETKLFNCTAHLE